MSDFELSASMNVGQYSRSSMKRLKHGLIPSNHDFNQSIDHLDIKSFHGSAHRKLSVYLYPAQQFIVW